MGEDVLRAAAAMQQQQAAMAGLRAHYAGLAYAEVLRHYLAGSDIVCHVPPADRRELARVAVQLADHLILALQGGSRPDA